MRENDGVKFLASIHFGLHNNAATKLTFLGAVAVLRPTFRLLGVDVVLHISGLVDAEHVSEGLEFRTTSHFGLGRHELLVGDERMNLTPEICWHPYDLVAAGVHLPQRLLHLRVQLLVNCILTHQPTLTAP